jgi:hypothetical protein
LTSGVRAITFMGMKYYGTLSEALMDLKKRGYREDFNLKPYCLECPSLSLELHPENFSIDEFHRFEGMSNPDDNSIVFAISSNDGIKGTLVDAYGIYADSLTESMIKKLAIKR